eukprot:gb/GECH01004367.1/.p1 GENE.gb/GECH01004367.1/~~gb/GECH01004367.1/.p1  ORF type:complete len:328 (+),score=94.43 gb/GECH01004367.1/:1-984(+)
MAKNNDDEDSIEQLALDFSEFIFDEETENLGDYYDGFNDYTTEEEKSQDKENSFHAIENSKEEENKDFPIQRSQEKSVIPPTIQLEDLEHDPKKKDQDLESQQDNYYKEEVDSYSSEEDENGDDEDTEDDELDETENNLFRHIDKVESAKFIRMQMEYKAIKDCANKWLPGIIIFPSSISHWEGVFFVQRGPYRNGIFRFKMSFNRRKKNAQDVNIKLLTDIQHPKIKQDGTFISSGKYNNTDFVALNALMDFKDALSSDIDIPEETIQYFIEQSKQMKNISDSQFTIHLNRFSENSNYKTKQICDLVEQTKGNFTEKMLKQALFGT